MLYGKACHLPFEFEHKALWAFKKVHLEDITSGRERLLNLHELEDLRSLAYENSMIYKEQRKKWHDAQLKEVKAFKEGDKVLIYQTRFKFSPGKLKSRWIGPYVVLKAHPSGYVDLITEKGQFRVNGQQLKLYHKDDQIRNGELSTNHFCSFSQRKSQPDQKVNKTPSRNFAIAKDKFRGATLNDKIVGGGIHHQYFCERKNLRGGNWLWRKTRIFYGIIRLVSNDSEKALETHEPIYVELVLEFLPTFDFDEEVYNANKIRGTCIKFRLLGVWTITMLPKFCVLLGLYTTAQSCSDYFCGYFLSGACEPSADFSGPEFWATIGYGSYQRSNNKESAVIVPEHRLLHRMLAHTLTYRRAIKEKVPECDLWLLSQLVDRNAITNLAYVMAKKFLDTTEVHDKARTGLCGGQFVTGMLHLKKVQVGWLPQRPNQINRPNQANKANLSQPNQPSGSSEPHGLESLHEAIKELSEQLADGSHDTMERIDRLSYDIFGIHQELSWITASMSEYFESVGHTPSATLAPFPIWPDNEDAPPGYSSFDEWDLEATKRKSMKRGEKT
ncbi:hypothetical protein OSB04_006999 [Centaurea solstitialis]|uniref:Uncharacterized protein n=1 Tax=Centaurea solstitialis TaxID=347529 RepID=A0AA38TJ21_9ASTR|nr:hypothetical protein OSB04_006999 [Centaurea solstitialis]